MCHKVLKFSILNISISQALLERIKQRVSEFNVIIFSIIIYICGHQILINREPVLT
jgi:hypothetical protein